MVLIRAVPPSYFIDRILELSEGKMFHSIYYGKNLMGSYAGQLTKEERWKVVSYIKQLQAEHVAKTKKISVDQSLALLTGKLTYKDTNTYAAAGATTDTTVARGNAGANQIPQPATGASTSSPKPTTTNVNAATNNTTVVNPNSTNQRNP